MKRSEMPFLSSSYVEEYSKCIPSTFWKLLAMSILFSPASSMRIFCRPHPVTLFDFYIYSLTSSKRSLFSERNMTSNFAVQSSMMPMKFFLSQIEAVVHVPRIYRWTISNGLIVVLLLVFTVERRYLVVEYWWQKIDWTVDGANWGMSVRVSINSRNIYGILCPRRLF